MLKVFSNRDDSLSPADLQMRLYLALGFDQDDLILNRTGQLSARQVKKLRHNQYKRAFLMILVILAGIVFTLVESRDPVFLSHDNPYGLMALAWLIVLLLGAALVYRIRRCNREILAGQIQVIEGMTYPQKIRTGGRNGGTSYILAVAGKRFRVNGVIYGAFSNDHPYRVFYSPYSKIILAAEYLG